MKPIEVPDAKGCVGRTGEPYLREMWQWKETDDRCRIDRYATGKEIVLVCRVPKIRKKEKVTKETRRRRKQRCGVVVGEVRRMLSEEHRLTEAEVNDYDKMVQDMYANYAEMPDKDRVAEIAYQALLHMDCNVMSDKQVQTLLNAAKHPFLSGREVKFLCFLRLSIAICLFFWALVAEKEEAAHSGS